MESLNDPRDIKGMAEILSNDDEDLDIDDLENSIIRGMQIEKKESSYLDIPKEYDKELESLSKQFNISTNLDFDIDRNIDKFQKKEPKLDWGKYSNPNITSSNITNNSTKNLNDDTDSDDSESLNSDSGSDSDVKDNDYSLGKKEDPYLNKLTNEERRQQHINKVMGKMDKNDDDSSFVQQEEEEDEMARIMEQIDLLRTNLESEGIDLTRIPEVNAFSNKKEARAILRMLQIKNDRLRYCDMFEEGILAIAYALEGAFDGKKEYLGTKVDLVGWPDTVKVKLRRMRYNTSSFVGDIMKGYNIGHGWRILLELFPSLFLYSRERRIKTGDELISDNKYREALIKLDEYK
jgi:hypothetical protein